MNKILLILSFLVLFSCIVKEGYVWEKQKEDYREYKEIKRFRKYRSESTIIYVDGNPIITNRQVYSHTNCKEYLVKDYPDYILVVKEKNGKRKTTYYVEDYVYNKLGIEHTYIHDIYRGRLDDFNNEYILLSEWREW